MVGLRRPKRHLLRQRRPTPGAECLERPIFNRREKAVQLSPNASLGAVNVFARASKPGLRRTG